MKKWVIAGIAALTLVLTGCGASSSAHKAATPKGPNASEVLNASAAAQAKQKNVHMGLNTVMSEGGQKLTIFVDGNYTLKPIKMLGTYTLTEPAKVSAKPMKLTIYMDGTKFYAQQDGRWFDLGSKMKSAGLSLDQYQAMLNGNQFKNMARKMAKQATVDRSQATDTVSMKMKGSTATKMVRSLGGAAGNSDMTKALKKATIKDVTYTFVIDRKTKLPTSYNVKMHLKDGKKTIAETVSTTYSKWNQSALTTPTLAQ